MWCSHCSPVCCMAASSLGATQSVPALCPVRQLFIHFSPSVHLQSFSVSPMLPFILSAGFTIKTITLVSLTMCTFILLPTYFTRVHVWALKRLRYYRLATVCVWQNGPWFCFSIFFISLMTNNLFCHFFSSNSALLSNMTWTTSCSFPFKIQSVLLQKTGLVSPLRLDVTGCN